MNLTKVKIKAEKQSIEEQLNFYIQNGFPVMLRGFSGVGKSQRVQQIDPTLTRIDLRNGMLPEEVLGLTTYPDDDSRVQKWFLDYLKNYGEDGNVEAFIEASEKASKETSVGIWQAPPWYVDICQKCVAEPNKKHVLFIDELTNVRPATQSLVYHIVLKGSIGANVGVLPENAVVVAAGNTIHQSASAHTMAEPLFRRFYGHLQIPLDFKQWKEWATKADPKHPERQEIHPLIVSYLEKSIPKNDNGNYIVSPNLESTFYSKYDLSGTSFYPIDPRGWKQVSQIIYESNGQIRKELLENKVGVTVANKILEYISEKNAEKNYNLNINTAQMSIEAQIRFYVENSMPFMLHGLSGIGKTERIRAVDRDLTSIELCEGILPEQVVGKVRYADNSVEGLKWHESFKKYSSYGLNNSLNKNKEELKVENIKSGGEWIPPAWYDELCRKCEAEPSVNHVLFIDELTNVSPHIQSLVYHIVLEHSIGLNYGKLPKNSVVVAAGNSIEESSVANEIAEPLYRRFMGHIYLDLNVQNWLNWGSGLRADGRQRIHPAVIAFVSSEREKVLFSKYDRDIEMDFAIDPRGWEQVSDIIYASDGELSKEVIFNKLGYEMGTDFIDFIAKPQGFPTPAEIVSGDYDKEMLPKTNTQIFRFLTLLASETSIEQCKAVRNFIKEKLPVGNGEGIKMFDEKWARMSKDNAVYLNSIINSGGLLRRSR